jgi:hypothetical protein
VSWPAQIGVGEYVERMSGVCEGHEDLTHATARLQEVDITCVRVRGGRIWPVSAREWNEDTYHPALRQRYREIEQLLSKGGEVDPPLVVRYADGSLSWIDGWHRISIALHTGRERLRCYVIDAAQAAAQRAA